MLKQTFSNNLKLSPEETKIEVLGERKFNNPKINTKESFELLGKNVLINPFIEDNKEINTNVAFQIAGPTDKIFFEPEKTKVGIVTCGGICPGLNNVIRSIVLTLNFIYDCKSIFGFRFGLQGFIPSFGHKIIDLNIKIVNNIHEFGGTILGTSRGPQSIDKVVDRLEELKINQLFFIGGDGSLKAAEAIATEVSSRKLKIAIIGIPKTIDNDIAFASETFGFDTAVNVATKAIRSAHVEASSHPNGIGLVKLMGRNSGFISAIATLSQRDVNYVLVPEKKFDLYGEKGLLSSLKQRLNERNHAVIVVAEGAGQDLLKNDTNKTDQSGNIRFGDIGLFLKEKIKKYFSDQSIPINLKYIDPSYMIRSVHSNTHDNLFAATLGNNAVHAAMSGNTNMMISMWHGVYCNVPLKLVNSRIKRLSLNGRIWLSAVESTGQPNLLND